MSYDSVAWDRFVRNARGDYADDAVVCTKDRANRPVCRRVAEATPAARRGGAVAALQRAADQLLNLIPAYQAAEVTLVGGERLYATFERDPIRVRSGYDGLLGPSAHGWINGAFILATALSEVPADVVLATFTPTEAVFARLATPLTTYFNGVVANIDQLIEAYKRAPRALPQLAPETIRVVEEVVTRRRMRVRGAGAIVAAGALSLGGVAALGVAKGAGAAKAAAAAVLLGAPPPRGRRRAPAQPDRFALPAPTLEQRVRTMSDGDLTVTYDRLKREPGIASEEVRAAIEREHARRYNR